MLLEGSHQLGMLLHSSSRKAVGPLRRASHDTLEAQSSAHFHSSGAASCREGGSPVAHLEQRQQRAHGLLQLLRRGAVLAALQQSGSRRGTVLRERLPHAVHRGIGAAAKLAELTSAALQRRQLRLQGLQAAQATRVVSL